VARDLSAKGCASADCCAAWLRAEAGRANGVVDCCEEKGSVLVATGVRDEEKDHVDRAQETRDVLVQAAKVTAHADRVHERTAMLHAHYEGMQSAEGAGPAHQTKETVQVDHVREVDPK
jgi:hypothetical protein